MDKKSNVLPPDFAAGPAGVGDPDDTKLRKVEIDIKIPQIMRDRAKKEKCIPEVADFTKCCQNSGLFMTFKCQKENKEMKKCLEKWYKDHDFQEECKKQYLEERRLFRMHGNKAAMKAKQSDMF